MFTTSALRVIVVFLVYVAPVAAQQRQLEACLIDAIRTVETSAKIKIMSSWDRSSALGEFSARSAGTPDGVFCGHAISVTGARFTMCVNQENLYTDNARKVLWSLILTARGDASSVDKSCGEVTMPAEARRTPAKTNR
jgi:hypothetical protein